MGAQVAAASGTRTRNTRKGAQRLVVGAAPNARPTSHAAAHLGRHKHHRRGLSLLPLPPPPILRTPLILLPLILLPLGHRAGAHVGQGVHVTEPGRLLINLQGRRGGPWLRTPRGNGHGSACQRAKARVHPMAALRAQAASSAPQGLARVHACAHLVVRLQQPPLVARVALHVVAVVQRVAHSISHGPHHHPSVARDGKARVRSSSCSGKRAIARGWAGGSWVGRRAGGRGGRCCWERGGAIACAPGALGWRRGRRGLPALAAG